jgi:hypothetical protein
MKTTLYEFCCNKISLKSSKIEFAPKEANLVLAFGDKQALASDHFYPMLRAAFPCAEIAMCTTAGHICNDSVTETGAVITAIKFEQTNLRACSVQLSHFADSYEAGRALYSQLDGCELSNILVLSDGELVNGSLLVEGIESCFEGNICVTGGLAADGENFQSTLVGLNGSAKAGNVVGIGFYGNHLVLEHGLVVGHEPIGRKYTVTKAIGNEVLEINGINAFDFYKYCLGPFAKKLSLAAIQFPIGIYGNETQQTMRSVLSVNYFKKTLTFAGDVPEGSQIRIMSSNSDQLISEASRIAHKAFDALGKKAPDYALLVSGIGRKMILNQRIVEEIEAVSDTFNNSTTISGFYSYGEIAPQENKSRSIFHNQTMCITTFTEY